MEIQCPKCRAWLHTENALAFHAIQVERCFPSSFDSIADKVHSRIETLQGQVEFLLRLQPETRGSDDWLEKWHQVIFQRTHYYDYATKQFIEKHGVKAENVKFKVKQASLGRLRRFTQRSDRTLYHDGNGNVTIAHECLLPSAQMSLIRSIEAEESRWAWYKRGIHEKRMNL